MMNWSLTQNTNSIDERMENNVPVNSIGNTSIQTSGITSAIPHQHCDDDRGSDSTDYVLESDEDLLPDSFNT